MELLSREENNLKDDVMNLLGELKVLMDNCKDDIDLKGTEEIRECFIELKRKFTLFIQSEKNSIKENDFAFKLHNQTFVPSDSSGGVSKNYLLAHYKRKNSKETSGNKTGSNPSYAKYLASKKFLDSGVIKLEVEEKLDNRKVDLKFDEDDLEKGNLKDQSISINWGNHPSKIERVTFGAFVQIGQLYNVKSEALSSQSLFSESPSNSYSEVQRIDAHEIEIIDNSQLSNRFRLFDVQPEQQLSIILDSSDMNESYGNYLVEENFQNNLSKSLFFKYETALENLKISMSEIQSHINGKTFKNIESTYVVVAVKWGAIQTLTLEHPSNINDKIEVKNMLNKEILNLKVYLESEHKENYNCSNYKFCNKLILKINGSIQPFRNGVENLKRWVESISCFKNIFKNTKGSPLKFILVPLSSFAYNDVSNPLKSLDLEFSKTIINFFEELTEVKKYLYHLEDKISKYFSHDYMNQIEKCKKEVDKIELEFKNHLRVEIPKLKSGESEVKNFQELFSKYEKLKQDCEKMIRAIDFKYSEDVLNLINFCIDIGITFLDRNADLSTLFVEGKDEEIFVLYTSLEIFNANIEIALRTWNYFISMAENPDPKTRHVLIDLDVNSSSAPEIEKMTIMHYKNGILVSSNVLEELDRKHSNS